EAAVQTVYEVCKSKIEQIDDLYTPTVGAAVPDMARKVMKIARGEVEDQSQILEIAAWVDAETGSNIESTIRADDCGLNDGNKEMTVDQCREWVQTSWNPDLYDHLCKSFTAVCDDTKEQVDSAWEELNDYFKDYTSEFPEGGDLGLADPSQDGLQDPGSQNPGSDGGTSPSGGGSTPSAPSIPEPEILGQDQGKNPVTGDELEVDPETGEPYPIDPETGEAVTDVGDDRDTLTVEKGDRTFEMTEPDEDGEMEISVDDGSGEPKEYKLDFGDGENDEGGQSESGDFGPTGAGGGAEEEVHRPGEDGKIHIEDGDLKITAERPEGPDGPTRVTVDDGTPPPTTYTSERRRTRNPVPRVGPVWGQAREVARTGEVPEPCPLRARTRSKTTRKPTPTRASRQSDPAEAWVAPRLRAVGRSPTAVPWPEAPAGPPVKAAVEEQPAAQPAQTRKFSRAVAPPEPAPEAPKPPPPPRPVRRRREEVFDDEDFSNNSWMQ
ncbi:hypothetical protein, partial [Saccharomonospora viridis]